MAESEDAAQSLIAKSPLTYQLAMNASSSQPGLVTSSEAASEGLETDATPEEPQAKETQDPDPDQENASASSVTKSFVIHIFPPSASKRHKDMVEDSPLYWPWPSAPDTTSFVARNLRMSIPESEMRDALADWDTGGQLRENAELARVKRGLYVERSHRRAEDKMRLSQVLRRA